MSRPFWRCLTVMLCAGCSEPPAGLPDSLLVVEGDGQSSSVGTRLPRPVVVRAVDADGNGVPAVEIDVSVSFGDGLASVSRAETDADGRASIIWTLNTAVGANGLLFASHALRARATAIGTRDPVTLEPRPGDSILYGGHVFTAPVVVDSTSLVAVVRSGAVHLYYAGLGGDLTTLNDDVSVRSVRHRVALVRQHWSEEGEEPDLRAPAVAVPAKLAGVSLTAGPGATYTFRNTVRRFAGLKFTPGGSSPKVVLPNRGDLISVELSNLIGDPTNVISFRKQPSYSRVISELTRCEVFGSIMSFSFTPLSRSPADWAKMRPELHAAIQADADWFGAVNRADATELYFDAVGELIVPLLDAPCLGELITVGAGFGGLGFTGKVLAAQNTEMAADAARELLDVVAVEAATCACELVFGCNVALKVAEVIQLAVRIVDDGIIRPYEIARTPHYESAILGGEPLAVTLTASSRGGAAPLAGVDLTATVVGGGNGTINYTFYCDRSDPGTDVSEGWVAKFDGITQASKTAADACTYSEAGSYMAKVVVERGGAAAEHRVRIDVSGPPSRIEIVSGNDQSGAPETELPAPLVARVSDENGIPSAGVAVLFVVFAGGGSVTPTSASTGPDGLAQARWTLGPTLGEQALNAVAEGLDGSPLDFRATATSTPDGWEFTAEGNLERFETMAAIAPDGTVFVPTVNNSALASGGLYAISSGGQQLWRFPVGGDDAPALSQAGELVHVGEDERLYVIDPASGAELCSVPLSGVSATSAALDADVAYVTTGQLGGDVMAIRISRPCQVLWTFDGPGVSQGFQSPAVVGSNSEIYAASSETSTVYALDTDGTLKWEFAGSDFFLSSPAIAGDALYIGAEETFYALDRTTGLARWSRALPRDVNTAPAVGPGGRVFVGVDDGRVYGFDSEGADLWPSTDVGDPPIRSSAAIGDDGTVYLAASDGVLVGVSSAAGQIVASHPLDGASGSSNSSSPTLAGGRAYVGSGNVFFAIPVAAAGLAVSDWPKFRHDLGNSGRSGGAVLGATTLLRPR